MKAEKIIELAKSYIGTKEYPAGSNNVIFNTHYYGRNVSGSDYPWCCSFVWDIFRMAGAPELFYDGRNTAYCPNVVSWGERNGLTVHKSVAAPGDIVLFDFNSNGSADHIGIIESRNANGTYTTIEGNTSLSSDDNGGAVMRRTRYQSQICCIIRPKYETEAHANPAQVYSQTDFIREVQAATGAAVDGIAGNETISKTPTLSSRKNNRHRAVRAVQKRLFSLGYTVVGEADGIAGNLFTQAVKAYQRANGCVVDGEITAKNKTWKKLLGME